MERARGSVSHDDEPERFATPEHRRFYQVLAAYKLGALGEMFYRRHLEGNAADPLYPKMESGVPKLAEYSIALAEGEIRL